MGDIIKFKRGLESTLPTLQEGEPGYCTDTKKAYIGTAGGNELLGGGGGSHFISVKDRGAKGDGSDDYAAIQAVITELYNSDDGGTIFFPPGAYRVSQPLIVPDIQFMPTVSWLGEGAGISSIVPSAPMDQLVRMRGEGGFVRGITFRGSDPYNGSAQYADVGMKASWIVNKVFSNVEFTWNKLHGLQILDEGNNNLCVFDQSCKFDYNGTLIEGTDGSGTADIITFSTLNPLTSKVFPGSYMRIGSGLGSVYHVDEVTATTVKISPALAAPLTAGTAYKIHVGNGFQNERSSGSNVYGIYDCHFVGNEGVGLNIRALYGHHVVGGNFDYNGIAGVHVGSGMLGVTPAYSGSLEHVYFENNGYANILLDYPDGLSIVEPILAEPLDGTAGEMDSIHSLRGYWFDYYSVSVTHKGRTRQYILNESGETVTLDNANNDVFIRNFSNDIPMTISLPQKPTHMFEEVIRIYIVDSGNRSLPLTVTAPDADINKLTGNTGVKVPGGVGHMITAIYNYGIDSWLVSYTNPAIDEVVSNTPPGEVTNLTATPYSNSVDLSWSAATNATSYEVHKDGVLVDTVSGTEYIALNLNGSTSYTFLVKAKNSTFTSTGVSVQTSTTTSSQETIYALDSFTRANNSTTLGNDETGKSWTVYSAPVGNVYGIQNNQAYPVIIDANDPILIDTGVGDNVYYELAIPIVTPAATQIMWRIADKDNYFVYENGSVYSCVADNWSLMGAVPLLSNGAVFKVELVGNEHKVYVNGVLQLTFTSADHAAAAGFGFAAGSSSDRYDNFKVAEIGSGGGGGTTNNESAQVWVGGIE